MSQLASIVLGAGIMIGSCTMVLLVYRAVTVLGLLAQLLRMRVEAERRQAHRPHPIVADLQARRADTR